MEEAVRKTRLELPWPPSLNHYYRHVGPRVLISKRGRDYRDAVAARLAAERTAKMNGKVSLRIDAYPPDNRRRDVDNLLKVVFDSLVGGGLFEDDSQIRHLEITMRESLQDGLLFLEATPYEK